MKLFEMAASEVSVSVEVSPHGACACSALDRFHDSTPATCSQRKFAELSCEPRGFAPDVLRSFSKWKAKACDVAMAHPPQDCDSDVSANCSARHVHSPPRRSARATSSSGRRLVHTVHIPS